MRRPGNNLPDFRARQLEFAAHIRNPEVHPRPADIEARRMKIYVELFYRNIENFLASAFPVAKKILSGGGRWDPLVRDFVQHHSSDSPYFLEIAQEFLSYLDDIGLNDLPGYLLELCHYEWVELALSVSELELPEQGVNTDGSLLDETVVVSPLIWKLAYRYPVHQLGESFQPSEAPETPTLLVVNRKRDDSVGFLVVNPMTLRLLELLERSMSGAEALREIAAQTPELETQTLQRTGIETLEKLRDAEILLGTEATI